MGKLKIDPIKVMAAGGGEGGRNGGGCSGCCGGCVFISQFGGEVWSDLISFVKQAVKASELAAAAA